MPYDIIIGRDEADKKRFGNRGLVYIGKQYVKMAHLTSLTNRILMDIARSHVILICGKRGSGKSYTLATIAEELTDLPEDVACNIAPLIFDTMGIFWTMRYANEKEVELLREWQLKAKKLPVKIFIPFGYRKKYEEMGIEPDATFAIKPSELTADDWCITFGLDFLNPVAIMIQRIITELQEKMQEEGEEYDTEDIIKRIIIDKQSERHERDAAANFFLGASTWGVFAAKGEKGITTKELVEGGRTTIIDLSCYSAIGAFNVRALVIGLVCKKLFNERMLARKKEEVEAVRHGLEYLRYKEKREMPLVWIFIDEGHEFLPKEGRTAATDSLVQLLREGRQPGISLVIATQQPGIIHHDALTQADIVIAHRVTAKPDLEALNFIMQTYLLEDIKTYMNQLPDLKGSAIILDDNSERIYPMRVRPRFTWHGGEAPTAIRIEKRE